MDKYYFYVLAITNSGALFLLKKLPDCVFWN